MDEELAYNNSSKKTMLTTATTTEIKKTPKLPSKNNYLTNLIIKKKEIPSLTPILKTSIGGLALLGDYSDSE